LTLIENRSPAGDDAGAITELEEIVERQRAAFLADPFPSLTERRDLLQAVAGMMLAHRVPIQEAMSADFGVHPTVATDLIEVLGVAGRAAYAAEQLETWMSPEPRHTDPALFGSAARSSSPSPRAWSATSSRGTSRSTSRSGRWSKCSRPATAS
jgi:coniferyl-aldehyde dehydrogenase